LSLQDLVGGPGLHEGHGPGGGRLQALSDDHFNYSPDEITWGHVGTLGYYAELLKRVTDSAFKEGEHAQ
jgi:hypothetical protein